LKQENIAIENVYFGFLKSYIKAKYCNQKQQATSKEMHFLSSTHKTALKMLPTIRRKASNLQVQCHFSIKFEKKLRDMLTAELFFSLLENVHE
jgi:hypothetical protein